MPPVPPPHARRPQPPAWPAALALAVAAAWPPALGAATPVPAAAAAAALAQPAQPVSEPGPQDPPPPPAVPPARQPVPPPPGQAESLPELLARTLPWDPQVRVARALLQAAEQRRVQARSRMLPVAGVQVVQGRSRDVELNAQLQREVDRAEATLRWNVLNYGNDAADWRASGRDIDAAEQELRRAREETAERIAEAYVDLLRLQGLLPHARQRQMRVAALVAQVRRQADAGRLSEADAALAETSLLDAEIALAQVQADGEAARQRLAQLVGGELRAPQPLALPPPPADDPGPPRAGAVAAAQERAAAARERVRPLVSQLPPRVDIEWRQSLGDRTTPRATTEVRQAWAVTARWDFPLGGESEARRVEGLRRAEASEAEAERVFRLAEAELRGLGPRIEQAGRALQQIDGQLERYELLLRAGELQFEAGRRTLSQLVQLHDGRYAALQRRAEVAQRLLLAQLRQLALTGRLLPALGQPTL